MPKTYDFEWHGAQVERAMHNAIARAEVAWGVDVAMKAKARAHRLTGTLSRSIHCAPGDYDTDETAQAQSSELAIVVGQTPRWMQEFIADVAAGSWINYALYEMRRGGAHDFLTDAVEEANAEFGGRMVQALMEEGWGT